MYRITHHTNLKKTNFSRVKTVFKLATVTVTADNTFGICSRRKDIHISKDVKDSSPTQTMANKI